MPALSNAQLELLKFFKYEMSKEKLLEIKQLLSEYLAQKLMKEKEKESIEKGYTPEIIDSW